MSEKEGDRERKEGKGSVNGVIVLWEQLVTSIAAVTHDSDAINPNILIISVDLVVLLSVTNSQYLQLSSSSINTLLT